LQCLLSFVRHYRVLYEYDFFSFLGEGNQCIDTCFVQFRVTDVLTFAKYVYKKVIGVSDEEYAELGKAGHIRMDFVPSIP
jgi:hypothetical protein